MGLALVGTCPYSVHCKCIYWNMRILSYVLTIEDLLNQENCGYIYSNKHQKWQKISVPLPHIVYNRIPLRSIESSLPFQQLKETFISQKIIMFNPCFIDKYEMYTTFKQHKKLNHYYHKP